MAPETVDHCKSIAWPRVAQGAFLMSEMSPQISSVGVHIKVFIVPCRVLTKDHPKKSQVEFTIWASADGSIIGVIWVPHGHMCHNGDSQSQSIIDPIRNRLMHNFRDLGPSGHIFSGIVLFCKYCKY